MIVVNSRRSETGVAFSSKLSYRNEFCHFCIRVRWLVGIIASRSWQRGWVLLAVPYGTSLIYRDSCFLGQYHGCTTCQRPSHTSKIRNKIISMYRSSIIYHHYQRVGFFLFLSLFPYHARSLVFLSPLRVIDEIGVKRKWSWRMRKGRRGGIKR